MNNSAVKAHIPDEILLQPVDAHVVSQPLRDGLIISMTKINDHWHVVSRFSDDSWWLMGATSNSSESRNKINFELIPVPFRNTTKQLIYRYLRKGCGGGRRPRPSTLARVFVEISYFLNYVYSKRVTSFLNITPPLCWNYLQSARQMRVRDGEPPNKATIYRRVQAVERVFLLSQHTESPMVRHPWPDSSSHQMAGMKRSKAGKVTPLIPDDVFVALFKAASHTIQGAPQLLAWRTELIRLENETGRDSKFLKRKRISSLGFPGTYQQFKMAVLKIRTACYIVIASLSGCRHHELAYLHKDSCYRTEDDEGGEYWWMRSRSEKTFVGKTEWMIPEIAVEAIKVLEEWAAPYQAQLQKEIAGYREKNPIDSRIGLAGEHVGALFVGMDGKKKKIIRTLSIQALNVNLREFTAACGLEWELASHQFRRKFANYAARSQFGDLRYLKEHYNHWSMDMTLGYALNESQEMSLYLEVIEETERLKESVVASWLEESEPLAGGYGNKLIDWRSKGENIALFKSHASMVKSIASGTPIRSNGHAWCTAEDNLCIGNTLEKSRCGAGCNNAVVSRQHGEIYIALYDNLKELLNAPDIGPGGKSRVTSDLINYANILVKLGYDINKRPQV